eukprot:GHVT01097106.1.p1 GENE.GHVT01097106.1~~GHVT01097106.1.p1  ORF type:complete len:228 (-),score=30.47 GHVT01097106.1:501-1184(-)
MAVRWVSTLTRRNFVIAITLAQLAACGPIGSGKLAGRPSALLFSLTVGAWAAVGAAGASLPPSTAEAQAAPVADSELQSQDPAKKESRKIIFTSARQPKRTEAPEKPNVAKPMAKALMKLEKQHLVEDLHTAKQKTVQYSATLAMGILMAIAGGSFSQYSWMTERGTRRDATASIWAGWIVMALGSAFVARSGYGLFRARLRHRAAQKQLQSLNNIRVAKAENPNLE